MKCKKRVTFSILVFKKTETKVLKKVEGPKKYKKEEEKGTVKQKSRKIQRKIFYP